jgi:glutamine---fructose-6-phosphate transaminase (isomerizing)
MSSILLSEINEQPQTIRRVIEAEGERTAEIGQKLSRRGLRYIMIAARGTSDNAARYGQYLFGIQNRLPVALAAPSLFSLFKAPPRLEDALVIGISQSGQSPDIVSVVAEARRQGTPTLAITNDPQSPLAMAAEDIIQLHTGTERSIAATKTYTAQLTALALLSFGLKGESMPPSLSDDLQDRLHKALEAEEPAKAAADRVARAGRCVVLGRGYNFATAFETALKIKELAYVAAEPYASADFKHGPVAMVESGFPVLLLAVGNTVRDELTQLGQALLEQGADLVTFGDPSLAKRQAHPLPGDLIVPVAEDGLPESLTPIPAIIAGQLFAYYLALARGHDPDNPRVISKVTLTL